MTSLDYAQVKRFALLQLKGRWVLPMFMQVITSIVAAMFYCPIAMKAARIIEDFGSVQSAVLAEDVPVPIFSMLLFLLIVRVFFVAEVEVYAAMTQGPERVGFGKFIEGFADWGRAVLVTLYKNLLLYLWAMLLFFPAVFKFYSYYFAEYIVAEFPAVSPFKAVGLSRRVTAGAKGQLFLLDITLLPWFVLGMALSGVGLMWAMPYIRMTHINAFHALLKDAINDGRISLDELGLKTGNAEGSGADTGEANASNTDASRTNANETNAGETNASDASTSGADFETANPPNASNSGNGNEEASDGESVFTGRQ